MKKLNFKQKVINTIKKQVFNQEIKNGTIQLHMCTSNRRFENRKNENKIPQDKPQCPVYNDNRCCGSCYLANTCEYAINCNCYGYCYGQLGGNDENYYMREESNQVGRIKDNKFDWDYYKYQKYVKNKKYIQVDPHLRGKFISQKISNNTNELKGLLENTNQFNLNELVVKNENEETIATYVEIISVDETNMEIIVSTKNLGGNYEGIVPNSILDFYRATDSIQ